MDAQTLVEDLLELEPVDEDSWDRRRNDGGTGVEAALGQRPEGAEAGGLRLTWRANEESLHVDSEGRVARPYVRATATPRPEGSVVLRSVVLLMDFGEAIASNDLLHAQQAEIIAVVKRFIGEFFELCPLGEVGIVMMYDKQAAAITPSLSANAEGLVRTLDEFQQQFTPNGAVSLQAGLEKALRLLSVCKPYSRREVLCLWSSTATHDAGLIENTIQVLQTQRIQINVVSLTPHLFVLQKLTDACFGEYLVVADHKTLSQKISQYSKAQVYSAELDREHKVIDVGFPELEQGLCAALCTCHNQLKFNAYTCPRCLARNCSIPAACAVCGLLLVNSLDIARCAKTSYDIPPFMPLPKDKKRDCYMCERVVLSGAGACLKCRQVFCLDCDVNIHDNLVPCPGCQYIELLNRQGLNLTRLQTEPLPPLPETHPHFAFYKQLERVYKN